MVETGWNSDLFFEKLWFTPPIFPPFLNASWFLLALNGNISSALWSLVDGTGLGCHLWPQSGPLVMFCLFGPECLTENMVVYRDWLVFPHVSWILFSSFSKNPQNPSGVGFVFRFVEGQALPIIAGFSKFLPRVVLLSWQFCSLGEWAALFSIPTALLLQYKVKWLLLLLPPLSRGVVCVGVRVQGCECGRCVQSLQSHQVRERSRRSPAEWQPPIWRLVWSLQLGLLYFAVWEQSSHLAAVLPGGLKDNLYELDWKCRKITT